MYPQKTEENSRYFTTQEFEQPLTAARQLMKLSIVVPRATMGELAIDPQSSIGIVKNVERTPKQLDTIQNLSRVARLYIYEKKRLNNRHILDALMSILTLLKGLIHYFVNYFGSLFNERVVTNFVAIGVLYSPRSDKK